MTENQWAVLICAVIMVGWCIGVGRMIYKRHKEKKNRGTRKMATNKDGKKLVEMRALRKVDRAKMNYIWQLQQMGAIGKYEVNGYAAYSPEEFAAYKKTARRGRPLARKGE